MNNRFRWAIFFLLIVMSPIRFSWAQGDHDYLEKTDAGIINWTRFTVQATGVGSLATKPNERAPLIALEAAKDAAKKNILQIIGQIRLENNYRILEISKQNDSIEHEIIRLIQNAQVVQQAYLSDGTAKVVMEFNLLGAFSQLVLPKTLKQIDSVKPIAPQMPSPARFTGFIVDAMGIGGKPALVPKIVDESLKEVFGSVFASREFAVQKGMARYTPDLTSAQSQAMAGSHPLIVKGLKTEDGEKTAVVISTADAAKLMSASEHLQLLRECVVVIALDPITPKEVP